MTVKEMFLNFAAASGCPPNSLHAQAMEIAHQIGFRHAMASIVAGRAGDLEDVKTQLEQNMKDWELETRQVQVFDSCAVVNQSLTTGLHA